MYSLAKRTICNVGTNIYICTILFLLTFYHSCLLNKETKSPMTVTNWSNFAFFFLCMFTHQLTQYNLNSHFCTRKENVWNVSELLYIFQWSPHYIPVEIIYRYFNGYLIIYPYRKCLKWIEVINITDIWMVTSMYSCRKYPT